MQNLLRLAFLLAAGLPFGAAPLAFAGDIAPNCAPLADPLATIHSCVVAATFPDVDSSVCFDTAGKPPACTARANWIAVAEGGTFEFAGKTYAGAPAGATHVAAAAFDLAHDAIVTARGVRPNGFAVALDRFKAPGEPAPVPPVVFTPATPAP